MEIAKLLRSRGGPLIAPSLLAADFARLGDEVRRIEAAGADMLHIDVMDGRFVPNITVGPTVIERLRKNTGLPFDVHLMIEDPDRYIGDFVRAGADFITVHAEACPHLHRTITRIAEAGAEPSVALNPATSAVMVEEVIGMVGMVLVMTVNPGFGGQKLISACRHKIASLKEWIEEDGCATLIQVDGGVTAGNIGGLYKEGVEAFVAGSSVFGSADASAAIISLKSSCHSAWGGRNLH